MTAFENLLNLIETVLATRPSPLQAPSLFIFHLDQLSDLPRTIEKHRVM